MNLRDLRYLVALAERRNFNRAAVACGVSQPTLSVQLRKLEAELGVVLVERNSRGILFTEVGERIVARARMVLHETAEIRHIAQSDRDPEAGSVKLGVLPTLGPYFLPHVLGAVRRRFPRLELLLSEEKTLDLLARLHEGELDAALVALPVHDETLTVDFLFEEPFVLAAPIKHRLALCSAVTLGDLKGENLLLLEDGHCLRDQALEVCRMAGASERRGFLGTSLETLRQMVAADVGCTLLPILAVQPPIPSIAGVHLTPFRGRAPSRRIAMLSRKSSAKRAVLGKLSDLFRKLPPRLLRVPAATEGGRRTRRRPTRTAAARLAASEPVPRC